MQALREPYPWLVADIGGTNARFGLVLGPDRPVEHVRSLKGSEHPSPEAAAASYLDALAPELGARPHPRHAALALATAIDGDTVRLTNGRWTVSRAAVAHALGANDVWLINDFEALALALPRLRTTDVAPIGTARFEPRAPMAVIGPGTGLGVATCVPLGPRRWFALAAEGGHVTLAAADDLEAELLRALRSEHAHVSAERVLSGVGLPLLHRALCTVRGTPREDLAPEEITRRARAGDAASAATLDCFFAMLGGFAGNVALTVGARGGVFLAGGIAQKLAPELAGSRFRERFEAKGRFRAYLERIATGLITAPHAALDGAAQAIADALATKA